MRNWSTNTDRLSSSSANYEIWQLNQQLNFGLSPGETINHAKLIQYLPFLDLDQDTRNYLEFILYDKKPAHQKSNSLS